MEQFLGEVALVPFNFAPQGWAFCNGQILSITQNTALFALLGTTYGGNGVTTFALPDLRGRVPIHAGQGPGLSPYVPGQVVGAEAVTLNQSQMAAHTHAPVANSGGGAASAPTGAVWAGSVTGDTPYSTGPPDQVMSGSALGPAGGNQPHANVQPYLALNYIIALTGVFPSRN